MDNKTPQDESKSAQKSPKDPGSPNDVTFGSWLKDLRSQKKISLEEIAAVTKVHISQLKALEENDRTKLPAPAFVRGFLVSYSRHLGIDENEVLLKYKASFESLTPLADILMPTHQKSAASQTAPKVRIVTSPHIQNSPAAKTEELSQKPSISPKALGFIFVGIAVFGLLIFLLVTGRKNKAQVAKPEDTVAVIEQNSQGASEVVSSGAAPVTPVEVKPALPQASQAAVLPGTPTTSTAQTGSSPLPSPPVPRKFQGEIRAVEQTWISIRSDDEPSRGMILKAGSTQPFEANRKADLSLSDAGSVEIKWNGIWYASPGSRGDVMTLSFPRDIENLKVRQGPPKVAPRPKPVESPATPAGAVNETNATSTPPAGETQEIAPQGSE